MVYDGRVNRPVAVLLGTVLAVVALAGVPEFKRYQTMQESLRCLPPNIRSYCMEKAGFGMWPAARSQSESSGLSLVGKWGAGPSYRVTGRDSIVYLSRGSEVVVINYADTAHPRVLNYIEAPGLVAKSILVGNRLYVSSGYIETFDVSNPANPVKLGSVLVRAPAIDAVDTLVYTLYRDSFRIFNFSDPAHPQLIGACRDSGYDLSVCNGYAYLGDRWGLYVLDVAIPTSPHRIAAWGSDIISVKARGNICCATLANSNDPAYLKFYILDTRNPASIAPLGSLDSCGGYDMYLEDSLAFISGYYTGGHEFEILDIADSTQPSPIGTCLTPGDGFGVWTLKPLRRSFVADYYAGLTVIDVSVPTSPVLDTTILTAGASVDVAVQGNLACVANDGYGMVLLDISVPSRPVQIGVLDSTTQIVTRAVAVRDSFAYLGFGPSLGDLHTVDISDPAHPLSAGGVNLFNEPDAIVLRDSFVYCAEVRRFEVVNVARPRQPVLVGSCVTGDATFASLCVQETLAYVGNYVGDIVNVRSPANPQVVGQFGLGCSISVRDTFAFLATGDPTLLVYSVADPTQPRLIDSVDVGANTLYWVEAVGSLLYVGNDDGVRVVDARDVHNMRVRGYATAPDAAGRLRYASPYLYAACGETGVCVYESTQVAVAEPKQFAGEQARKGASVVRGVLMIGDRGQKTGERAELLDASGRKVMNLRAGANDVRALAPGVYFVREAQAQAQAVTKVVLTE